jgi:hypothetical protein
MKREFFLKAYGSFLSPRRRDIAILTTEITEEHKMIAAAESRVLLSFL